MRTPFSPLQLVLFIFVLVLLLTLVQIGLVHIAAEKLGIDFRLALFGLLMCLVGSVINLPLFTMPSHAEHSQRMQHGWLMGPHRLHPGRIIVAINLGGAVLPICFSCYLFLLHNLQVWPVLLATLLVSLISFSLSRPVPGLGIAMPVFIPPVIAALTALLIDPEHSAPLAYIAGTLGVIIGADLLRLKTIQSIGAPVVSIGGAGTFDGIFLTGIVAVLLA